MEEDRKIEGRYRSARGAVFGERAPPGLQAILDGMLAKDPALRFATPVQAAQELRRVMPSEDRSTRE
jgi:hypothetical protein